MRGLPGSGKTTYANELVKKAKKDGYTACILCTYDFFEWKNGKFMFEGSQLTKANRWTIDRAKAALRDGYDLVIIDNVHSQMWQARPYVEEGIYYGYEVQIIEMTTSWCTNFMELRKRSPHNISFNALTVMDREWESRKEFTVENILKAENRSYPSKHHEDVVDD